MIVFSFFKDQHFVNLHNDDITQYSYLIIQSEMSLYGNGNFKLEDSWQGKKSAQKGKKRKQSQQGQSLMRNLAANLAEPSTDMLDDSLSKLIMKDMQHPFNKPKSNNSINNPPKLPTPSGNKKTSSINKSTEDKDLLASMANRLQKMQKTCQSQRQQIREQREQLQKVKTENAFLKGMKEDSGKVYSQMSQLRAKNKEYEEKVKQMEEYLKNHGLKWVGNKIEGKLNQKQIKKQIKQSKFHYRLPTQIDFSTIQRRILDLNSGLESQGFGTQICNQRGIHKFKKAEHLPIAFYSNGIVIKGYNFYSYKSKESLKILADLMDGYFPYLFKAKYPDGVLLEAIDKIQQTYVKQKKQQDISGLDDTKDRQFQPQSREQFLNKLPKQVIKNGKVINIRGQIDKMFDEGASSQKIDRVHIQEVQGLMYIKTRCYKMNQQKLIDQNDLCLLKIRAEDGKMYMLQMEKTQKIKDVSKQLSKVKNGKFKIMGNFPRRTYEDDEMENLEQLGFYPNANLHIQMIK